MRKKERHAQGRSSPGDCVGSHSMTSPASFREVAVEVVRGPTPLAMTRGHLERRSEVGGDELQELDRQMALLADGDRSAIEPLFRALWPVIQGCCKRALGDGADADDAAQQAMEKIFNEASRYDR